MGGMYGMGMGGTGGGMALPTPHQASHHHQHYHHHHHHHHHHHNQHPTRPAATSPTSMTSVLTSTTWGPTSTTCPPPPSTTSRPSTTCQTHHWQLLLQCQPRWWLEQPHELNGPGVQKNVLQRARITPKHYFKISMIEKWRTTQRVIHVKFVTSELNVEEKCNCKAKRKVQNQPRNLPYYHKYYLFKSKFSSYDAPLVALLLLLCENCDICWYWAMLSNVNEHSCQVSTCHWNIWDVQLFDCKKPQVVETNIVH